MFKHFSWNQSTELSRKLNSNTIDAIHRISQCAPTEDGRTWVECRFGNESNWLTQKLMAELFQKDVRTVNEHIQNVFAEAALSPDSVIRKFRITAADGKTYETQHYSLEMILAVGYRVKSPRGTQFRQWATARLSEFLLKGFVMDDERLKYPPGTGVPDYFDELLERIRDIRASERRMYLRVKDILALAGDNVPYEPETQVFFQTIQNKLHLTLPPRNTKVPQFPGNSDCR
jgi:hypothetical protein